LFIQRNIDVFDFDLASDDELTSLYEKAYSKGKLDKQTKNQWIVLNIFRFSPFPDLDCVITGGYV
jgi:hypothetical protein